ncbi:MAG: signal peptidase II [Chlorobi bacterium]|nr:MAG: Signal peptidase II [Chlorobi bacterium OLB7]MBK8912204.1 signal peptidase II [Chlorobiota bacterium]MBX7215923.1 signal peptidase II [Candidatus Kapabacteria bacterium]
MRKKIFLIPIGIVLFDQITKLSVKGFDLFGWNYPGMMLGESRPVLGDFLRWTFVENPGMAFGLDFGMPVILSLFSVAASIFLVHLLRKTSADGWSGLRIALALILGGAAGNLIDRVFYGVFYNYASLFYGRVVDFVDVDIPDFSLFGRELERFYIFNIADAAVSIGVVLLLFFYPAGGKQTVSIPPSTSDSSSEPAPDQPSQEPSNNEEAKALPTEEKPHEG